MNTTKKTWRSAEPLYLVNRSGNRPSHEQADVYLDKAADLCRQSGFRKITMRGDTDFTQTKHLDRWDSEKDVRFIFGFDADSTSVSVSISRLTAVTADSCE